MHGFASYSMEFQTPDDAATDEEWLQLMRCAMLDSQFLISRDGVPRMCDVQGLGHI